MMYNCLAYTHTHILLQCLFIVQTRLYITLCHFTAQTHRKKQSRITSRQWLMLIGRLIGERCDWLIVLTVSFY